MDSCKAYVYGITALIIAASTLLVALIAYQEWDTANNNMLTHMRRHTRIQRDNAKGRKKRLFVRAMWGLANHLRTYNVAYELSLELNRQMIIVNHRDYEFYQVDFNDFAHLDGIEIQTINEIELKSMMSKSAKVISYNVPNDCTLKLSESEWDALDRYDDIVLVVCGIIEFDNLKINNVFYNALRPTPIVMNMMENVLDRMADYKALGKSVVGVHIRQGSIQDYYTGYFFGSWENSEKKPPTMCCFDNESKNLSSCPDSASGIERFVSHMKKQSKKTVFFVCSDRPGCILYLEQEFPGRIIYNPQTALRVETKVDTLGAFCDWYCLSRCDHLILTGVSSFSTEAIRYRGRITYDVV